MFCFPRPLALSTLPGHEAEQPTLKPRGEAGVSTPPPHRASSPGGPQGREEGGYSHEEIKRQFLVFLPVFFERVRRCRSVHRAGSQFGSATSTHRRLRVHCGQALRRGCAWEKRPSGRTIRLNASFSCFSPSSLNGFAGVAADTVLDPGSAPRRRLIASFVSAAAKHCGGAVGARRRPRA